MDKNTLTPYEKVLTARKQDRPNITEYIEALFDDFIENFLTYLFYSLIKYKSY